MRTERFGPPRDYAKTSVRSVHWTMFVGIREPTLLGLLLLLDMVWYVRMCMTRTVVWERHVHI